MVGYHKGCNLNVEEGNHRYVLWNYEQCVAPPHKWVGGPEWAFSRDFSGLQKKKNQEFLVSHSLSSEIGIIAPRNGFYLMCLEEFLYIFKFGLFKVLAEVTAVSWSHII